MNKDRLSRTFKKRTTKALILTVVVTAFVFLAYIEGFIPICLSVKAPVGNIEKIMAEVYIEKYPEFSDMPSYDKIVYEIFGTDASIDDVLNNYKKDLENEGYTLKREGTGYATGKNFRYVGYLKGFTAVGITITPDAYEEFGYETVVLYMTGNAFDFIPLLKWYQEKYDPGAVF